jgi:AcrR family transcriptional regulator
MTPRPRKVSDDQVFAAAYRAMSRLGPAELTLAEIAAEAGVTAGALVQRFGSKRALQLALAEAAAAASGSMLEGLRAAAGTPLAALRAYAECLAGLAASPAAVARNLAYLQEDVSDPGLRKHLAAQSRSTRAGLARLIEEAVASGELVRTVRPAELARTVETVLSGGLFTWALYQEGPAARWMREELDKVLAPHLPPRRPTSSRPRSGRARG